MRILKLEFQNLNSLSGQWEIDFTADEFIANGIFAITGATGAGKSTILDAISLALYGKTPRLKVISKSSNEIMTRGAGCCFAKVTFEVAGGVYIATWGQKRAHGKEDGNLQDIRHVLDDALSGKNITDKINDTRAMIEDKVSMNFEQFTRSMLLAQGEFAKFLNANTSERAAILEKITDTQIYGEISKEVHARKRDVQNKLEVLKQGIERFSLLTVQEVAEIRERIVKKKKRVGQCEEQEEKEHQSLALFNRQSELDDEYRKLLREEEECLAEEKEFADSRKRICSAELAAGCWSDYQTLEQYRKAQKDDKAKLVLQQNLLPAVEHKIEVQLADLQKSRNYLSTIKTDYAQEEKMMSQVVEIDVKLSGLTRSYEDKSDESTELLGEIESFRDEIKAKRQLYEQYDTERSQISEYLNRSQADKDIARSYKVIEESLGGLKVESDKIRQADLDLFLELEEFEVKKNKFVEISDAFEQVKVNYDEALARHTELETELSELKGDKELSVLIVELDSMKNRLNELNLISSSYQLYRTHIVEQQQLRDELDTIERELVKAKEKLDKYEIEKKGYSDDVENLTELVRFAEKFMTLEEHRKNLKEGCPCPLCGALEHPFAKDDMPEADGYIEKLGEAQAKLELTENNIRKKISYIVSFEKDRENTQIRIAEKERQERGAVQSLNVSLAEFGLMIDDDHLTEKLTEKIDVLKTDIETINSGVCKTESVARKLSASNQAVSDLKSEMLELSATVSEKRESYAQAEKDYNSMIIRIENNKDDYNEKVGRISQLLSAFGLYSDNDIISNDRAILADLKSRDSLWHKSNLEYERINKEIQFLEQSEKNLEEKIELWVIRRSKLQDDLQGIVDEINQLEEKRNHIFGSKKVDDVQRMYAEQIEKAENIIADNQESIALAREEQVKILSLIETLQNSLNERESEMTAHLIRFGSLIKTNGFDSEEKFLAARISVEEMDELKKAERELEDRAGSIKLQLEKNRSEYELKVKSLENVESFTDIENRLSLLNIEKKSLLEEVGSLTQLIENDRDNKVLHSDKLEEIQRYENDFKKWKMLHELIGSADGKAYRNYAQGLTFDIMLKYANRELVQITDRYLLVRAEYDGSSSRELLDLEVIDKYQAQSRRSAKNLSGGESFIVSLALALGLSRMSSNKIQVNSLFLDEGFGTLDDEALDSTLSALARLQQQGKLIGIISHVPALKERIATQITVETVSEGRGKISGAGCRKIS